MSFRLGIKCFESDDAKPIHNRPVWQRICKIARLKGIRVYVKDIGYALSDWGDGGEGSLVSVTINEKVPNWNKPMLLAKKICLWVLTGTLTTDQLDDEGLPDKAKLREMRLLTAEAGAALYKEVLRSVYPLQEGISVHEDCNAEVAVSNDSIAV